MFRAISSFGRHMLRCSCVTTSGMDGNNFRSDRKQVDSGSKTLFGAALVMASSHDNFVVAEGL
jgi:hypothetical protein